MSTINTSAGRVIKAARSAVILLLAAVVGTFVAPSPAAASSGYMYSPPGGSYVHYFWDSVYNSMELVNNPLSNFATGKCLDGILDWTRDPFVPFADNHMDARLVRTCKNLVQRSSGLQAEDMGWDDLVGLNKLGTCYGTNQATNSSSANCIGTKGSAADLTNVNTNLPNNCVRAWVMTPGGNATYGPGGDSFSCSS